MAQNSESGDDLFRGLPAWMPTDESSGNFKLLDVVGRNIDALDADIEAVDKASTPQDATSVAQLRQLAKLVALPPEGGESTSKYRARVIAEFQTYTAEGTARELIENAATLLDLDPEQIEYSQLSENGVVSLNIPNKALENVSLTGTQFADIIEKHVAAGYRVETTLSGTFTYLGTTAYTGPYDAASGGYDSTQLASDATKGHDGLDINGDPKDTGGTYAGVI